RYRVCGNTELGARHGHTRDSAREQPWRARASAQRRPDSAHCGASRRGRPGYRLHRRARAGAGPGGWRDPVWLWRGRHLDHRDAARHSRPGDGFMGAKAAALELLVPGPPPAGPPGGDIVVPPTTVATLRIDPAPPDPAAGFVNDGSATTGT